MTRTNAKTESDMVDGDVTLTAIGEEGEDETFRQHNVYEKLIAQTKNAEPNPHWRAELDEL